MFIYDSGELARKYLTAFSESRARALFNADFNVLLYVLAPATCLVCCIASFPVAPMQNTLNHPYLSRNSVPMLFDIIIIYIQFSMYFHTRI